MIIVFIVSIFHELFEDPPYAEISIISHQKQTYLHSIFHEVLQILIKNLESPSVTQIHTSTALQSRLLRLLVHSTLMTQGKHRCSLSLPMPRNVPTTWSQSGLLSIDVHLNFICQQPLNLSNLPY